MLERRTGDSRNDVGLRPGGIVMHGDREIGSFAGDKSLYLAELDPAPESEFASLALLSSKEREWRLSSIDDRSRA